MRVCAYALAPRASFELTWTCGSTNEDAIIKGNVKCRNILRGLTHSHASPLRPIGGAFLVIATHRPTRLTGFTRVIIIYSLDLPPSIILSPSLPTLHSYKRQVDLLTCVERLADDFWEEHLHAGRLGRRLPRKTSAHNYWHERDGRPRQQYQYIPSARHRPFIPSP